MLMIVVNIWKKKEFKNLVDLSDDGAHDWDEVGGVSETDQAKHAFELLKTHHRRCSSHEPHYCCMWQEVHYEPKPAT